MDYAGLKERARGLLERAGKPMTLRRTPTGGSEPWNPEPGTPQTFPGVGALLDYRDGLIDGTLILVGDRKAECVFDEPPQTGDILETVSGDYRVMRVTAASPAGIAVKYTLQVRR